MNELWSVVSKVDWTALVSRGTGELAEQEPALHDDVLFGAAACRYLDGVAPWHCAGTAPIASRRPATAHAKRSASEARDEVEEVDEAAIALEPGGHYPPRATS